MNISTTFAERKLNAKIMRAVIEIDMNTPQARQFVEFARTLPFAEVKTDKSKWQQALDEGAVTVEEFIDELKARISRWREDNA
jgi:hypothetical protein